MEIFDGCYQLQETLHALGMREPWPVKPLLQVAVPNVFHFDDFQAPGFEKAVNLHDVAVVVEGGEVLGF